MGMNYYWHPELIMQAFGIENVDRLDPKVHIGKTNAAGKYCFPCGITQHGETRYVHEGPFKDPEMEFLRKLVTLDPDVCPNCNNTWSQVNSFTFTMMGHLETLGNFYNIERMGKTQPIEVVVNEYYVPYTAVHFLDDIIRKCPIQFQSYGRWS